MPWNAEEQEPRADFEEGEIAAGAGPGRQRTPGQKSARTAECGNAAGFPFAGLDDANTPNFPALGS